MSRGHEQPDDEGGGTPRVLAGGTGWTGRPGPGALARAEPSAPTSRASL